MRVHLVSLHVSLNKVFFVGTEEALSEETSSHCGTGTNMFQPYFSNA